MIPCDYPKSIGPDGLHCPPFPPFVVHRPLVTGLGERGRPSVLSQAEIAKVDLLSLALHLNSPLQHGENRYIEDHVM